MMTIQFIKIFRYRKYDANWSNFRREKGDKRVSNNIDAIICYEWKKSGHVKYDCLNVKNKSKFKKNKKALTWNDKDDSTIS
jgi:hypothetical protein